MSPHVAQLWQQYKQLPAPDQELLALLIAREQAEALDAAPVCSPELLAALDESLAAAEAEGPDAWLSTAQVSASIRKALSAKRKRIA